MYNIISENKPVVPTTDS